MNRSERRRREKLNPRRYEEELHQAFVHQQAGRLPEAEALYQQVLKQEPDQPDAMRLLGEVLCDMGKAADATTLLRRLVNQQPEAFISHYTLANAYRLAGNTEAAISTYQAALARNPNFAGAHHGLGLCLRNCERDNEAARHLAAAARAAPGWAVAWRDLGFTLVAIGELQEAAAVLTRALALDPALADVRRHLLALRPDTPGAEIGVLRTILANPATPPQALVETGFALGKLLDRAGQYDEAFVQFALANQRLRALQERAGRRFDRTRLSADVDQSIAHFTREALVQTSAMGNSSKLPVFIVGMPRSGTSLAEQIAASHPQIYGAGEITLIGQIAARLGSPGAAAWTPERLHAEAESYLAALARHGGGAARVIDKMPDNIFHLGLAASLFPKARIIFCERDPLDTCWSCFTQRFSAPYGFDTDLADCGFRYRQIERLARHWQAVLPNPMLRLSYEALVTDREVQSHRLVEFLGLNWDPVCLDFHNTRRTVKTASWVQVRQPAYDSAIGRTKSYITHLAPLTSALSGSTCDENMAIEE